MEREKPKLETILKVFIKSLLIFIKFDKFKIKNLNVFHGKMILNKFCYLENIR